jgi:TM2 domain-containing membrane protein YozV
MDHGLGDDHGAPTAASGWYTDPSNPHGLRYWNGAGWTDHTAPGATPSQPQTPSPAVAGTYQVTHNSAQVVAPKNPALMAIVSFFIPGLGSILNGDTTEGVLFLVAEFIVMPFLFFIGLFLIVLWIPVGFAWFGVWVWAIVHAYQGAVRWNAEHGIIS